MAARQSAEPSPTFRRPSAQRLAPIYAERLENGLRRPARRARTTRTPTSCSIAVILSAQTTDVGVNKATPALFERYPDARGPRRGRPARRRGTTCARSASTTRRRSTSSRPRAASSPSSAVRCLTPWRASPRFPASRARPRTSCWATRSARSRASRSTRTSSGWRTASACPRSSDPNKVERDLMAIFPHDHWHRVNYDLITHGRAICTAKRPLCGACFLNDVCPSAFVPAGWRQD